MLSALDIDIVINDIGLITERLTLVPYCYVDVLSTFAGSHLVMTGLILRYRVVANGGVVITLYQERG